MNGASQLASSSRRGSPRQHAVLRLLRSDAVRIHAMGEEVAFRVGLLLAAVGTHDVVDAHVAILAAPSAPSS